MRWDAAARTLAIPEREGRFPGMAATHRIGVVVHGDNARPVFEREPDEGLEYNGTALELRF